MQQETANRKPTRDYRALSAVPWTLWDVMYARRSHRKYLPTKLDDEFKSALRDVASLACNARGADEDGIIPVLDPLLGNEIKHRLYRGLVNKINLWLARAPVDAFLVMAVPTADVKADRPLELPKAAMAVEDCVLWLAEQGLGTCWLGGVNASEIKAILKLEAGIAVPAAVCIGKPSLRPPVLSYDNFTLHALSRRRKPLSKIACSETLGEPYAPVHIFGERVSAVSTQGVADLLRILRDGGGEASCPLGPVVEASLEAARIAPSSSNTQAWRFVVILDEKRLPGLARACGDDPGWRAGIVAVGDEATTSAEMLERPFWMMDVPIALSHMSLMAASAGCAVRVFTEEIDEMEINGLVGASGRLRTVGVMAII